MPLKMGIMSIYASDIAGGDTVISRLIESKYLLPVDAGYIPRTAMRMRHRTSRFDLPTGAAWRKIRERIFNRDGYKCTYCGATDRPLECDHIFPAHLGGSSEDDNLTTACKPCNRKKSGRHPDGEK